MQEIARLKPPKKARIGLYSAGLKAYWDQFEGLKERMEGYNKFIADRLQEHCEVFNFGLVDDEIKGRAAGEWLNSQNVDLVFCHAVTYFPSAMALPIHQICKAPVVILNLQPAAKMNYAKTPTGEWLAHCGACPLPEICNALERAGIDYTTVNGLLGLSETPKISLADEVTISRPEAIKAWKEIVEWTKAAQVKRTLMHSRFGFLGNSYSGMLDMYTDLALMQADFGLHVEILEMCDLDRSFQNVTDSEIEKKLKEIDDFFRIEGDSPSDPRVKRPSNEQLKWSARVAVAQEKMVREYDLDSISYYYHSSLGNAYEDLQSGFIVGHSLLTASGIPCAGEGDFKTAIAMKICDILDTGGSFCEIVACDFDVGSIIMGHDGPFHIKIADEKPVLRGMGVYHGKRGSGISVEANVKVGPVTNLGLTQIRSGKSKLIISEGQAVKGQLLTIGNTATHVKFDEKPAAYMDKWFAHAPTHHFALSVGHNAGMFAKAAKLLGIEYVTI